MNNLDAFSKIKRRNNSLLTQPQEKMYKNASQKKRISPFSKLGKSFRINSVEYSNILPKNMLYDKQTLYLEVLSLKMQLNQTMDENIRLKTRIIALEKQINSASIKTSQYAKEPLIKFKGDNHDVIRNNQALLIDGLKKIIKQTKKQNEVLKSQNLKMKKNIKISKSNQFQIELSTIISQNSRIATLNEELQRKLQALQLRSQNLQNQQLSIKSDLKQLQLENKTLKSYIKAIELDHKIELSTYQVQQRKPRQLGLERSKKTEGSKSIEEMKRQFLLNKDNHFRISKKQRFRSMKMNYNMLPPRREPIPIRNLRDFSQEKTRGNQADLQQRNILLEEENKKLIQSCESLSNMLRAMESKLSVIEDQNEEKNKAQQRPQPKIAQKETQNIFIQEDKQKNQASEAGKPMYSSAQNTEFHQKGHLQRLKEQQAQRAYSQPQILKKTAKTVYKPNIKLIDQIRDLLTYRLMAQRYTYNQLKADIEKSSSKQFSYIDLCHMFVNEPFYLTVDHCRILLSFMLQKQRPNHNDTISSMTLIAKLRRVIKDFQCLSDLQEHKAIEKCANVISENSKFIRESCFYQRGQNATISFQKLKEMLTKLKLMQTQINLIIGQLSICSQHLTHLNLDVLFERFDLNEIESNRNYSKIIEEAENDDSFINSKHKDEAKNEENAMKTDVKMTQLQNSNEEKGQSKQSQGKKKENISTQI